MILRFIFLQIAKVNFGVVGPTHPALFPHFHEYIKETQGQVIAGWMSG